MSEENFSLAIENTREKPLKFLRAIIAILIALITTLFFYPIKSMPFGILFLILIYGFTFLTIASLIKKHPLANLFTRDLYICSAIAFFLIGNLTIGLAIALAGILDIISLRKWVILFTNSIIKYPAVLKPTIAWEELDNVICKDGLLSIDFKNKRLIQHKVLHIDAHKEQQFNEFCHKILAKYQLPAAAH